MGYRGAGTLVVTGGGQVSNTYGCLGYSSTGAATVTGAGSTWTNSGALYVGHDGAGTLLIAGLQDYDPGALFDVLGGTMVLETDAGSAGADLSISVTHADLYFGSSQHLDTLALGEGGQVVFAGARTVVLKHLVMDGVDLGSAVLTPEPATLALVALGGLRLVLRRSRT